ncbi:MAG: DUF2283 domain-containing protein [Thermodesulfobacteriota bacterium]
MGKEMRLVYDEEGDVLDVSLGEPQNATSREVGDDIFIRFDTVNDEIVGFSILNFRKWFKDARDIKTLPLQAEFAFISQFDVKQP